ncbi:UvrD/REP helicase subfamily [Bifidobacterium actinocoloniiforme DSM 22766]|uniref:DNA 3'-5' helicase n=1 Tax=Bifidobacterium actinocoloniiforme DSM 22766 TaxID=1437605 RepID=A0A086YZH0_9BIFI|nr:UvrD-helicase domain-containing protein [Bifidobacterium actinocoloniiforme]AKV54999.1 hypothetical protein AB656_00470 [Bifidobacterium actinocoloniiforme DSM 22766]KFI39670.1 UvrD/REP helicase subfamily [Bifidobacterium actinocoloniiforme DSM 22766]
MNRTREQDEIIDAPEDQDLLVIAGAGSGKTTTMTGRIVSLIERDVPPESILGLTFTNKAASELLSRVSMAVAGQVGEGGRGGLDPDKAFLKPDVRTYDAFFQSIVRQYGLLVGMDQGTQPLSDAGAFQLAARVVQEHLDLIFPSRAEDVEQALDSAQSEAEDRDEDGLGAFDRAVKQVLALTQSCSTAMISRQCPSFQEAVDRVRAWDQAFIARIDDLIGSQRVIEASIAGKAAVRVPKWTKKDTPETYQDKIARMREARGQERVFQAAALRRAALERERLLTLAEGYQEAKRQAGMAEFSDFTLAAFQLVTRFPAIGAIYRRRYTHVFLDEYQDTSTTQALLLAALFHPSQDLEDGEGPQGDSGDDQPPAGPQRSAVTAVGDPFQSIYAWRGASPGAFRTFQREFGMEAADPTPGDLASAGVYGHQAQRPLSLSRTFRNARVILESANRLTEPLRIDVAGQPASSARLREVDVESLQARDGADAGSLGLVGYMSLGQEVDGVVRFVREAKARYAKPDKSGVDDSAPHVAVLFRSKTNLPAYRSALEEAGLSVQVVGYSALFDRPESRDLLALLRVLCDHTDSASLLRLLASPRFNMTVGDLSALADLTGQLNTESLYQALVQAGRAPEGLRGAKMSAAVRGQRDLLPAGVFLTDLLLRDDLPALLASRRAARISERGRYLLLQAADVLREAQARTGAPLRQAVLAASRALGLDVDLVVSQALATPEAPIDASAAKSGLSALFDQVDAYCQELPDRLSPTLAGFVAWIDAMRTSPGEPASGADRHADVVLMTIHQAKGLEWDAVAVVGMRKEAFPSNQGDRLKVKPLADWEGENLPMAYESTAQTWLNDPTAVPAPVRADAAILPSFPHWAEPGEAPEQALAALDLTSLEDEAVGGLRANTGFADDDQAPLPQGPGQDAPDAPQPACLSQSEEYGRRLHDDERRLAYVALTRARHDLLLTFSAKPADPERALLTAVPQPGEEGQDGQGEKTSGGPGRRKPPKDPQEQMLEAASNFWLELNAGLADQPGLAPGASWLAGQGEAGRVGSGTHSSAPAMPVKGERLMPLGRFVGDHAVEYERAVVGQALAEAPDLAGRQGQGQGSIWPVGLSPRIGQALAESAAFVARTGTSRTGEQAAGGPGAPVEGLLTDGSSLYAHAVRLLKAGSGRLGVAGDLLVRDDQALRRVGSEVTGQRVESVTSIQARSGALDERSERRYWRSVVRPVPQVDSPLAQAGTAFHAWAASFLLPDALPDPGAVDALPGGQAIDPYADLDSGARPGEQAGIDTPTAAGGAGAALSDDQLAERRRLLAQLADKEAALEFSDQPLPSKQADRQANLLVWERRLADSPWAHRRPHWVERPIVALIAGRVVKGKLDAVFDGGLEAADGSKRFTIVDWKTGHRPRNADERRLKLEQLDLYRLLFSRLEDMPLDSIDACLYYISEADPSVRTIVADPKGEREIEDQVRSGLPEQSDDD